MKHPFYALVALVAALITGCATGGRSPSSDSGGDVGNRPPGFAETDQAASYKVVDRGAIGFCHLSGEEDGDFHLDGETSYSCLETKRVNGYVMDKLLDDSSIPGVMEGTSCKVGFSESKTHILVNLPRSSGLYPAIRISKVDLEKSFQAKVVIKDVVRGDQAVLSSGNYLYSYKDEDYGFVTIMATFSRDGRLDFARVIAEPTIGQDFSKHFDVFWNGGYYYLRTKYSCRF